MTKEEIVIKHGISLIGGRCSQPLGSAMDEYAEEYYQYRKCQDNGFHECIFCGRIGNDLRRVVDHFSCDNTNPSCWDKRHKQELRKCAYCHMEGLSACMVNVCDEYFCDGACIHMWHRNGKKPKTKTRGIMLKAEGLPGIDMFDAYTKAKEVATELDCLVNVFANDHYCLISPDTNIEQEIERYLLLCKRK